MATITEYITHQVDIEDRREIGDNLVRDKIILKTSEQVSWTRLRSMRPVPAWNQPHPREAGFYLDFVKPKQTSELVWELECEYTPQKGGQVDADPTARPAEITFTTSLVEQPASFDSKGRPIVNTAGQLILGIIEHVPLIEYSVRKNLSTDPAWLQTHLGAVNQDVVTLRGRKWDPKTLMLTAASGGPYTTENRTKFSEITLTLMADARTWSQEVWNRGTVQLFERTVLIGTGFKTVWSQKPILHGNPPSPVDEPVFLDIDGQPILDHLTQTEGQNVDVSRVLKLNFLTQKEKTFSGVLPLK